MKTKQKINFPAICSAVFLFVVLSLKPAFASEIISDLVKVPVKPVQPFYTSLNPGETPAYQPQVVYLSPLKNSPIPFSSIGASWQQATPPGTSITLEIKLHTKNGLTDWYPLEAEIDTKDLSAVTLNNPTALLTSNESDGYQYRVTLKTSDSSQTPLFENLKFTFINGGSPDQKAQLASVALHTSPNYKPENQTPKEFAESEAIPDSIDSDAILGRPNETLVDNSTSQIKLPNSAESHMQRAIATSIPGSLVAYAEQPIGSKNTVVKPIKRQPISSTVSKTKIISRSNWGADESLRLYTGERPDPVLVKIDPDFYEKFQDELKVVKTVSTNEDGKKLTWPMTYPEKISKIIIHHTATTKNLDDPKRAIRDIYYWHSITKGWGDIGYNYIIDPYGNVYEGRFGGEMVVGAHAGKGNVGSIGIAVLGNYQENDVLEPVAKALVKLLKEKTQKYNIDPTGNSIFRGQQYNNIIGHRDIMTTACPGDRLYSLLPMIRKLVKADFKKSVSTNQANPSYNLSFVNDPSLTIFSPKGSRTIELKIKNTGVKEWGPNTVFRITTNDNAKTFIKDLSKLTSAKIGSTIKRNGIATVKFALTATQIGGTGLLQVQPLIDGKTSIGRYLQIPIQVTTPPQLPKYDYQVVSQELSNTNYKAGDLIQATIKIKNLGSETWSKTGRNPLMLGADSPRDHINNLLVKPSTRLASMVEESVKPTGIATFKVSLKLPASGGYFKEAYTPVVEGITWMSNKNTYLEIFLSETPNSTAQPKPPTSSTTPTTTITPSGGSSKNISDQALNISQKARNIRVDLSYRGNPAIISGSGNFSLYDGTTKLKDFTKDTLVTVKLVDGSFVVNLGSEIWKMKAALRFIPASGTILRIDNWERYMYGSTTSKKNEFRGVLEAFIYDNELHILNDLPLEDYVKGIAEESGKEPYEKIKTIMILSRTYARFYMEVATKFPGAPFNLNDDPNYSQKYDGYSFEKRSPITTKAANETAGMFVTYQGKLIKTPFFSQSNGRTISAKTKWGWTDTPFLQSVDDSACGGTEFRGHGVGLSGCGAKKLAEQGKTFAEIIKYFYQGVEVTQTAY